MPRPRVFAYLRSLPCLHALLYRLPPSQLVLMVRAWLHPALLLSLTLTFSPHPGGLESGTQAEAVLGAGRLQLERLRLRLSAPGALATRLRQLQQEAELQQDRIRAFESDLVEILADKQNLEDILRSLPEGCSKWQ